MFTGQNTLVVYLKFYAATSVVYARYIKSTALMLDTIILRFLRIHLWRLYFTYVQILKNNFATFKRFTLPEGVRIS
jgi:hypothetical protein